jgi:ABC-type nitrate/sulfonate/bicarbonate transport system substrate-binding protein
VTRRLRIGGVPEHFNLPWRLAVADRAFEGLGVTVDYREIAAGTGEMTRALREGELDVALVLTEGAVADILAHDANRLVKVWVRSPLTWGLHVAADSPWRRMADLRNRPVAISRYGSGSHLIAIVDAAARGWDTGAMKFVVVNDLEGAKQALAAGEADLFLWEKHMTQPLVDAGRFRRLGERAVPWPAFVVSVRKALLPDMNANLRAVLGVAERYVRNLQRRRSAAALIASTYGLSEEDARAWLAGVRWAGGYRRPAAALQRVVTALGRQGVVHATDVPPGRIWSDIR